MAYTYSELRDKVLTDPSWIKTVFRTQRQARSAVAVAGVVTLAKLLDGASGDSWMALACVDVLVEAEVLVRVHGDGKGHRQDEIYAPGQNF